MRAAFIALAASLALQACAPPIAAPASSPTATATGAATTEPAPSAEVTQQPSPIPTPTPFSPCISPQKTLADISMAPLCIAGTDTFVEASIGGADLHVLFNQVETDLAAVQREFEWTLRGRPVIDVFGTTATYTTGLIHVLGYSGATAAFVAENSVAFFEPELRHIVVNWEAVRERRPIAAIRHELTHFVTLEACAPRCDLVPAWLNEGQAHLAEATIPGGAWRLSRVRYEAASMVATNTFMPLSTLVTQHQWNNIVSWAGYYKYQEAARATELLREDIGGVAPIGRVYERIRQGEDVASAYATLTGRRFESFAGTLASRISEIGGTGPAIVVTDGPQADGGVGYLLYGFDPEAKLTLRVSARRFEETEDIAVSPQGAYFSEVPGRYPPGSYTLVALSGTTVIASVTFDKRGGRPYV